MNRRSGHTAHRSTLGGIGLHVAENQDEIKHWPIHRFSEKTQETCLPTGSRRFNPSRMRTTCRSSRRLIVAMDVAIRVKQIVRFADAMRTVDRGNASTIPSYRSMYTMIQIGVSVNMAT